MMSISNLIYSIYFVAMLGLWTAGFVDLADHVSEDKVILGQYSPHFFGVLALYSSGFLILLAALIWPRGKLWVGNVISYIQTKSWRTVVVLIILGVIAWGLFQIDYLAANLMLRAALLGMIVLTALLIIFAGWGEKSRVQPWRKAAGYAIIALVAVEISLQLLALVGRLPNIDILDSYFPYSRVYYNQETLNQGLSNNGGWYYPDFELEPDSQKILLVGDSFIRALEIEADQNAGVKLQERINAGKTAGPETEVLGLGFPGFGPGLYLDIAVLAYPVRAFDPDEVVVVMQLGSDLDNRTNAADSSIYFELDERGNARVHPDSFKYWHDLAHFVTAGFQGVDPVMVLRANFLTPRVVGALTGPAAGQQPGNSRATASDIDIPGFKGVITEWGPSRDTHTIVNATTLIETPGASNYLFKNQPDPKAEESLVITRSLIKLARDYAAATGMTLRLVTIPAFPKAFYQEYKEEPWQPEFAGYDLFQPDRELKAFAAEEGIPFLSAGQLMYDLGLQSDEIKTFFFSEGTGHLTPAGHQFLAEAIYDCFYAVGETSMNGEARQGVANFSSCEN